MSRRTRIAETAAALGLEYLTRGTRDDLSAWSDLPEIRSTSRIEHLMRGALDGRALAAFQTTVMIYTGQATVPVVHTVYAAAMPEWPAVHVTPRAWPGRVLFRLGRRRGLMLDDERFNERFKVRTSDETFAITLLPPRSQAILLEKTTVRWRILNGRACLIYRGRLRPERVAASLERLSRFLASIPEELAGY